MSREFDDFFLESLFGQDIVNVKAEQFGATGLGIVNDQPAIQAAINWALDNNKQIVICPPGTYKLDDTVHTSFGVVAGTANYNSIQLIGAGSGNISGPHFNGTKFLATFQDRPIVSMQGMFEGGVRGIAFQGPVARADLSTQPFAFKADPANWKPTGAQDNQWTPFCAVCIDPYYLTPPGGAPEYPPPSSYPALAGTVPSTYGGKQPTSKFFVEQCSVAYVTVAVYIYGLVQAEFGRFNNNEINFCKTAYALGNSQARNMDFSNNKIHYCHTCWDGSSYGPGTGNLQGCYDNITTGYGYQLFQHTQANWSKPVTVNNLLNEFGTILGTWIGGTAIFNECAFELMDATFNGVASAINEFWQMPIWKADTGGPSTFKNCLFTHRFLYHFECDALSLENCVFQASTVTDPFGKLDVIAPGMRQALALFGGVIATQSESARRSGVPVKGSFGAMTHSLGSQNVQCTLNGPNDSSAGKSIWSVGTAGDVYRFVYDIPTIVRFATENGSIGSLTGGNTRVITPDGFLVSGTGTRCQIGDVFYMANQGWWYVSAIGGSPNFDLTIKALTHVSWNGTTWAVTAGNSGTGTMYYYPTGILDPWPNRNDESTNGIFMKTTVGSKIVSFVDAIDAAVNRPAEIDAKSALFFYGPNTKFLAHTLPFPSYSWIDTIATTTVTMNNDALVAGTWLYAPGIKKLK